MSTYFEDLYLYLAQNRLPNTKLAIQRVKTLAKIYIIRSLLFKLIITPKKNNS